MGLPSANVMLLAPVPPVTAAGDGGARDCGDVVFVSLFAGFKFLALLFSHTMRMMMTIVTTSSTASNDTTTTATIPADKPLVVLPPDFLSVVEKQFTSAKQQGDIVEDRGLIQSDSLVS